MLSEERFAESLVHRRAGRHGSATIRHEMRRHGLDEGLIQAHVAALADTEFARAGAVRERRFGALPETLAERARQTRFLLARGFSAETVRRVLRAADDED